jgi:3',5'-cyclic AMP phosphodiesterase CpdA
VVTGGDLIMDGFENSEQRTREQWDLWTRVFRDECAIPVEHTLGNHDIWGWNKARSGTTGGEPMWGKRWACDLFGWQRPYRVVERGAWRLVILDSVQPRGDAGYTANLDPEQMEWLRAELARDRARHVCVVSHIPILGVTPIAGTGEVKDGDWHINGSLMHTDSHALIKLFKEAGNVRLCLSGHIHKLDRCEYEGTTYVCGGAVCGAWWKGPRDRVAEGYGLVDLYADGTFDYAYQTYGWVASEA